MFNSLKDYGSYSSIDRSAHIPDVAIPEYIPQNTPEKIKEYINFVEEEIDVDNSHLESLISDIEKSIENYSSTNEDIKKELGEEVRKNVMEDVGSTKMEQVSVHNEQMEITDDKNKLKLQRNKYLTVLSDQERILADFLFYSEYKDVSMLSIDENKPAVIQKNEELRHNLECSVLLDIVNPANPDMHLCMTKTDFLCLAPKTWLTWASIDACSYLFNRREEEKPRTPKDFGLTYFHLITNKKEYIESIIAEKEIDLESVMFCKVFLQGNRIKRRGFDGLHHWNRRTIPFTWRSKQNDYDCGVYCIKATEWYDRWNEKKHLITTLSTAYTTNLSQCHLAIDLVSYKKNRRKQEVFKECALWSARKPFLIQQQKKRKDKEKHLENLPVKRVEKVFIEDEKIKKERERHVQE
ncbi:DNA-directed RNA polymerase subunit beta', partial [Bienertia sinuspersici]